MIKTVFVCSTCGRTVENKPNWTRGWLIAQSKNAEDRFNGVMVIRCPLHITDYALRKAEGGRSAIRTTDGTISLRDATENYGINVSTLRQACYRKRLPATKRGRFWRVRRADLENYLSSFSAKPRKEKAMEYQYWSHQTSGETWAVQLNDSIVVGACGPLYCEDHPADMRDFEYSPEDGEWVEEHKDEFAWSE